MRYLFFLLSCFFLCCCSLRQEKYNFDFYGDDMLRKIPDGFVFDTTRKVYRNKGASEIVIMPELSENEYREADRKLQDEILRKMYKETSIATEDDGETQEEDTSYLLTEITPLTIYKNNYLISYGFLNILSGEGVMRPYRKYFSVNYSIAEKKFIYFGDYFKIITPADSALVKEIVYESIGTFDFSYSHLDNDIVFAIDSENVYFFFDQFGELGNPMGLVKGVKKKYLKKYINQKYK